MSRFREAAATGLRLRCPRCREAPLFEGLFRMHAACPACGHVFEREPGYFVGAIYINYGATVGICLGGYLLLEALAAPPLALQLILWGGVCAVFPVFFFRYARALWLSLDDLFGGAPAPPARARTRGE